MTQGIFFPLVQNAALLLALVYLYDAIPWLKQQRIRWVWHIMLGLVIGAIGMTIMSARYEFAEGIYFDTRGVLLSVSGLYFGAVPTLIASAMMAIYRYGMGGPAMVAGIAGIAFAAVMGILWRIPWQKNLIEISTGPLLLLGVLVHIGSLLCFFIMPFDLAWELVSTIGTTVMLVCPLATLLLARLLARRLEIERDEKIKLQDDFLFRSQFNVGNIGIAITSVDKHWIKVNPRLCQMLKYSEKELLSMNWEQMSHEDDISTDLAQFNKMLAGTIEQYELNKRFYAKDGSIVHTHMTVACKRSAGRVQLVIAGFMDISAQTQSEMSVRASREQLSLVLASAELGFWDWDLKSDLIDRNERCAEMLGCSVDEMRQNHRIWMDSIHPDDRMAVLKSIDRHLQGHSDSHNMEYRIIRKSGEILWIRDTGRVMQKDSRGKALRMCGVHLDITQVRHNQEQMELAASVYNNSSEAMSVMDHKGNIITVNAAFADITGYSAKEVQGAHISQFYCSRNKPAFYDEVNQAIKETGRWQGEMWQQHKNGKEYLIWLTVNTIYDAYHRPHRRVALFSDITEKKAQEQIIWQQANYDPLTKLPNRRMLLDYLDREISLASRQKVRFALLFLDLDFFKEVNDTLGHDMGDKLLIECADRIKACVRDSDVVARLGGDEFTVMIRDIHDVGGVERAASKILKAIAEPFQLGSDSAYISVSIGITLFPEDASTREALLKNADQAMYAAKEQGRNRFNYFTPSMQEQARYRMRLIQDLRFAIEHQQFSLVYQPIVHLQSGKVHKAEALLRWHHPERGYISPTEFIPVAEDTGLIMEIGSWVFEHAARQCRDWHSVYGTSIQLSVNKSPVQFRDEGENFERWVALLEELELTNGGICIEITEGLLLDASSGVAEKLLTYRDAGIQVSLDDFGTGYSSLAYLKKFDIDYLKIDQSFTRNLEEDASDRTLCEAIIVMAQKLGMKVIAEGVETLKQQEILTAMGCDYAQGYLYSAPVSRAEFEARFLAEDPNHAPPPDKPETSKARPKAKATKKAQDA
ncbi:EAL domain-containing protein [Shewanella zhangzhouensis]|uniref:EAL domain-containing protein n=1 Tax=Shewanella zhangzhouensis TaxID=2864213 RepID=UPI001C657457|nr:EAL domain-containing protein [Shewanella zhangzhouensis]QYK04118.1 EAL domain-containing protein [Shewanella zhangzhouensis]